MQMQFATMPNNHEELMMQSHMLITLAHFDVFRTNTLDNGRTFHYVGLGGTFGEVYPKAHYDITITNII